MDPDKIKVSSEEKIADVTELVCPFNVLITCPVQMSHNLIVKSLDPDNIIFSSVEKTTELTSL